MNDQYQKPKKTTFFIENFIIFIIHILLLLWIIYILYEAGTLPTDKLLWHFAGVSLTGSILIFGTAKWAMYRYGKKNRPRPQKPPESQAPKSGGQNNGPESPQSPQ